MLTEEQWRAIEKISDALTETADLQQAIHIGLDILLTTFNRPGGALFIPRFCEHIHQDWTCINLPDSWGGPNPGHEMRELIEMTMRAGAILPGSKRLNLAAGFPIQVMQKTVGVLMVSGPVIPPEAYAPWLACLRPFARMVIQHTHSLAGSGGFPSYIELMRSRNTLRAMFDSLPISIYIIDGDFNLVAINTSRAGRVGERPNKLVGRKCFEKLYHRSEPCPGCLVHSTFETAQNTTRLRRDWLDHEKFTEWEISTFPILEDLAVGDSSKEAGAQTAVQTIIIEQDVTEKRNLEAHLIQSEKLAAVGQLAAGVAHEINNPLTAIIANAQILRRESNQVDEDLLESVKLIEMAGTRASQVVRNLLGIARKEKYEFEPIELNETLHNAISLIQHELVGRPIQVELNLADGMPDVVASQDQLQGVWINLILNAIDALDKGNGKISVVSGFNGREFEVSITDNGKGIAADHLPRVFEPFFTTKVAGRGTGLGLSVCMRVIKHHGGNIQVDSQKGNWTRFTVTLPGPK